jgi:hypothetical protein
MHLHFRRNLRSNCIPNEKETAEARAWLAKAKAAVAEARVMQGEEWKRRVQGSHLRASFSVERKVNVGELWEL